MANAWRTPLYQAVRWLNVPYQRIPLEGAPWSFSWLAVDHDETNDPSQVTLTGEPSKQQPSATGEAPQDGSPPKPAEAAKPAEAKP